MKKIFSCLIPIGLTILCCYFSSQTWLLIIGYFLLADAGMFYIKNINTLPLKRPMCFSVGWRRTELVMCIFCFLFLTVWMFINFEPWWHVLLIALGTIVASSIFPGIGALIIMLIPGILLGDDNDEHKQEQAQEQALMLQKKQEENALMEMINIENEQFISSFKEYPFVEMSEILKQALKLYDVKSTEFAIRRNNTINSGIRFIYKTDWSLCDSLESNNKICVRRYKKRDIKEVIEEKEKLLEIINLSNYKIYDKLINAGMSNELAKLIAYNEKFLPCQTTIYRVLIILKVNLLQFDEIFKIHEYTRLCQNGMYYFIRMCIEKEIYDLDFINSQIFHHTEYHLI